MSRRLSRRDPLHPKSRGDHGTDCSILVRGPLTDIIGDLEASIRYGNTVDLYSDTSIGGLWRISKRAKGMQPNAPAIVASAVPVASDAIGKSVVLVAPGEIGKSDLPLHAPGPSESGMPVDFDAIGSLFAESVVLAAPGEIEESELQLNIPAMAESNVPVAPDKI